MTDPLQKNFTDRINFIIEMLENIRDNCGVLDADDLTDQYVTFAGIAEDISRIKSHIYWTAQESRT